MKKILLQSLSVVLLSSLLGNAYGMTFSAPRHNLPDVVTWIDAHDENDSRIYADGEITDTTADELQQFVQDNHIQSAAVLLNSPGGSLIGGMKLGTTIRKLGFDTGIATYSGGNMIKAGICASACVYAFAGGVGRYYSGGDTRLGIHQFYAGQGSSIDNQTSQETSGLIVAYLQNMGVNALAFTASAEIQPTDIYWLSVDDALKLHFANNGTQATTAELKQLTGKTYLKIEQHNSGSDTKFILSCSKKELVLVGAIITNPQDAKEKYDWAEKSFFEFDKNIIQELPKGIKQAFYFNQSMLWVQRVLTTYQLKQFLDANTIQVWAGGGGAIGEVGTVDVSDVHIKAKIIDYVKNCLD